MIITIARKCGCDGDIIGQALADKYGLKFYNRSIISQIAEENGVYDKFSDFYGEIPLNTLMYSIAVGEEKESVIHAIPQKALSFLDENEGFVIQGRCGNFAYKDRDDVVSIFLFADEKQCVDTIEKKHGVSRRKASEIVEKTNERRSTYHKYYTGQTWGQAWNYDLCLNISKFGVDGVIEMVDKYISE